MLTRPEAPASDGADVGQDPWWADFYDERFADAAMVVCPTITDEAAAFLWRELRLSPGALVFDQCCGEGRLSFPLAARGARTAGVDQSEAYIRRARAHAEQSGLDCVFACGDAREFTAPEPCEAAFNWWSGFGLCVESTENSRILRRAWDSLRPGGRYILDYPNVARLLREHLEHHVIHVPTHNGTLETTRIALLDLVRGLVREEWSLPPTESGVEPPRVSYTRLYLPHEIAGLLEGAGFEVEAIYGTPLSLPLHLMSDRCIVVARKPFEARASVRD